MKKFFVQTRFPDGSVDGSMESRADVIELLGFRDCSGCTHEVYDVSEFGKVVKLYESVSATQPANYHVLCSSETGEVIIEGESSEH